jgi:hypothetical protein
MALQTNTNVKPYYDDWEENKNYHRVMFKAGFPVQARELTQSQTILQDQIEKLASRFLANGDQVQPGEFSLINPAVYVRVSSITQGSTVEDFVGYYVTGATSGVRAQVQYAAPKTEDDDATFYVSYVSGGSTSEYKTFLEGEVLESSNPNFFTATVGVTNISKPVDTPAMGHGVLFNVTEGTYYVNGFMVNVENQTIIVEKYDTKPTCLIGFFVDESFITSNQDESLLDNSQGSSNFAAPGADRLKIELTLTRLDRDVLSPNFIRLATLLEGNMEGKPLNTVKWDWLFDILAKRTYDESGNYIINDFVIRPLEYVNTEELTENGFFEQAEDDLGTLITDDNGNPLYPPVPPKNLRDDLVIPDDYLTFEEADSKYVLNVSPGSAYIQGYEVGFLTAVHVFGNKARTLAFRENSITQLTQGVSIVVTNVYGNVDIQNSSGDGSSLAFDNVVVYRSFIDGHVGDSVDANGRPLNRGNAPWTTYHVICDGTIGQTTFGDNEVYRDGNSAVIAANVDAGLQRGDTLGGATILFSTKVVPYPSGVMRPRYMFPNGLVDSGSGYFGYNSTFKLGVLESSFFTEFALDSEYGEGRDWVVGDLVYGERSQAIGLVEEGSSESGLVLSNIVGRFVNDEIVYQGRGGARKESRILREGEVIGFAFTDAGPGGNVFDLSGETSVVVNTLGSELTLTVDGGDIVPSATEIALTKQGRDKMYAFPFPSGSPFRTNRINYQVTTKPSDVGGFAIVIPGKITNTLQKTKSFFSSLEDLNDFSADISVQNNAETDIILVAQSSLFTGAVGDNYVTCDSLSGDPSEELNYGDVVTLVNDAGVEVNKMVFFVTKPVGYGTQRSSARIYFTTTLNTSVTGKTVQRVRLKTQGTPDQILVYELPQQVVKTLEKDPLTTGIDYQVYREFFVNVPNGSSSITITTGRPNEQFISNDSNTSLNVAENLTRPQDPNRIEGRYLTVSSYFAQDNNTTMVFNLSTPITDTCTVKIITPIQITNAKAKRKIYREDVSVRIPAEQSGERVISLGVADGFALKSVKNALGVDITNNYIFDDGQRDNIYDLARIVLKEGRPAASGELQVVIDYFDHDNLGDFFSVDSYTDQNGIPYDSIPLYYPRAGSPQAANYVNAPYKLRDCIDFRPIVNTVGTNASVIAPLVDGVDAQHSTNFRDESKGGNAFVPRIPVSGSIFESDLEYYLPQYNSLFIEKSGALTLVTGEPAEEPTRPADLADGARLYDLYLPAYTFSVKDIKIKKYNYKRYRMKDIANIDRRVERMEEIISLSLLEQSSLNMSVRDAVTGLDRFKNGIIVDNFSGHSRGNVYDPQYRNSIDPKRDHLRAAHFTDSIQVEESYQTDEERKNLGNYVSNQAGIVTVPYNNTKIIDQPFATRVINLQPYSVFCYEGLLALDPPIDTFQDTNRRPDLVIEDNNIFDALTALTDTLNENNMLNTFWGDWENQGSSSTSSRRVERSTTGGGPFGGGQSITVTTDTTTTTTEFRREEWARQLAISSGEVRDTSYGDRVVDVALARTMRSTAVFLSARRMRPNTRLYAFFDGVDVSAWVSPDTIVPASEWPDGVARYGGRPNTNPGGFGLPLVTDSTGNFTGVFLIPNGRPPVVGYQWTGNINDVDYQTSGTTKSFATGTRTFRLTSDRLNRDDRDVIETFSETNFVSSGVIQDKQETIVSTRLPAFAAAPNVRTDRTETRVESTTTTRVDVDVQQIPVRFDPVAQSFLVDNNFSEGAFVTELDVFFQTKDLVHGCEAYLVTTDGQVPTQKVLPHSQVTKNSDSTLRVQCQLGDSVNSTVIPAGTTVVGAESGATGVVKSTVTFESAVANPTQNVTNKVYNIVLSNYMLGNADQDVNNEFFPGEALIPQLDPLLTSTFNIVNDEYDVFRLDLKHVGVGYTTATVNFSEPELPGGVTAEGEVKISNGMIYEIKLTSPGSGYVKVPSVTIDGDGDGATALVRVNSGTPAVVMGCATSDDGTAPTKFKFHAPVYLRGNTWYAFVVKAPNSLEYRMWTCKLGENKVGTEDRVFEQPNLGSIFKSQNGGLWTEDQTVDVKFALRRAKFLVDAMSVVPFVNKPLDKFILGGDPIETNGDGFDSDSDVFGENSQVVKVYHIYNGLAAGDLVALSGITGDSTGKVNGIPVEEIIGVHEVIDADLETFTIKVSTAATDTGKLGGGNVTCTFNRPYEVCNLYTGLALNGSGSMRCTLRSTQAAGVSGYNSVNQYQLDNPVDIVPMESYYFDGAKMVAHPLNEAKYSDTYHLRGQRSLETGFYLTTVSDKVSPVLDLVRTDAIITRNLIDNPFNFGQMTGVVSDVLVVEGGSDYDSPVVSITGGGGIGATAEAVVGAGGDITSVNVTNGGSGYTSTPDVVITDSTGTGAIVTAVLSTQVTNTSSLMGTREATIKFRDDFDPAAAGIVENDILDVDNRKLKLLDINRETRKIKVRGSALARISESSVIDNPTLAAAGIERITRTEFSRYYIPEEKQNGSVYAKWISRLFVLENPCDGIEIKLTTIQYERDDIRIYFKARGVGFDGDLGNENWIAFNGTGLPNNVDDMVIRSTNYVNPSYIQPQDWQQTIFTIQDLAKFDAIQIKIVMTSNNPAKAPLIDDFQMVCSE